MNFWQKLKKEKNGEPIFVLAPMADVTDPAFRYIISKKGKPDVFWTEFVSADGLFMGGYDALIKDLVFSLGEKPIIAQFFTSKPEMMERASKLVKDMGFDGVDINMGCPDRSVEKQGAGASLIKNKNLAKELILSAKAGAGDLPVSVKTRIGYNKNEIETWIPNILEAEPALITVHTRTRKEMSKVPARWEHIKETVLIRDDLQGGLKEKTLIFGNGDVLNLENGKELCLKYGADGVMLGRAIFGNPWLFSGREEADISAKERLETLIEHSNVFEQFCSHKNFAIMKKHFKSYLTPLSLLKDDKDWHREVKSLRVSLMDTKNANSVENLINDFINKNL